MAATGPRRPGPARGLTSGEKAEPTASKKRIADLEAELAVSRRAVELLKEKVRPEAGRGGRGDGGRVAAGPTCLSRVLDISESGYYERKTRAPSQRAIRHAWLTDLIRQIHLDSRRT